MNFVYQWSVVSGLWQGEVLGNTEREVLAIDREERGWLLRVREGDG